MKADELTGGRTAQCVNWSHTEFAGLILCSRNVLPADQWQVALAKCCRSHYTTTSFTGMLPAGIMVWYWNCRHDTDVSLIQILGQRKIAYMPTVAFGKRLDILSLLIRTLHFTNVLKSGCQLVSIPDIYLLRFCIIHVERCRRAPLFHQLRGKTRYVPSC